MKIRVLRTLTLAVALLGVAAAGAQATVVEKGRFADEPYGFSYDCGFPVEVSGVALRVAASVGVVWVTPDLDVGNALLLADQAMYRAKQAGGDRWVLSSSPPEDSPGSTPSPSHVDGSPPGV